MHTIKKYFKKRIKTTKETLLKYFLRYPKRVKCNVCGWSGKHFLSDSWHKNILCPGCKSEVRHRLFVASLEHKQPFLFDNILQNKKIIHFAPEAIVSKKIITLGCGIYATADLVRKDCDLRVDISNMHDIADNEYDALIAFDVLEHVYDWQKALSEINRILKHGGYAILTVPQLDNLKQTKEDLSITTPKERKKTYGNSSHLRLFGDDFSNSVEKKGFAVTALNENSFAPDVVIRHVLFPPELSSNPLATNYRKVFFCQKIQGPSSI